MDEDRKIELKDEAVSAFETAENCNYVSRYSSASEVEENAFEILQWMPNLNPEDLSDEEFEYAVECLINELY